MKKVNYKKYFMSRTANQIMDFERDKLNDLPKEQLVNMCKGMISCIADLKLELEKSK